MCYPKPGPRCSASAAARYARAKHAAYAYFEENRGNLDFDAFEKLSKAREEAEHEYQITPAGIKALERSAQARGDSVLADERLTNARAERAARIKAAQARDIGDHHAADSATQHQTAPAAIAYQRTELSTPNTVLPELSQYDPDVNTLLDESEAWVAKLNADEIEALHWYSMGGYEEINGGLSNPNFEGRALASGSKKKAADAATIALLDSAMAKTNTNKAAVVYRRHFFYSEQGAFGHLSQAEMQAQFQPGSIYRPGFYMSTSLNPRNVSMGTRDDGFMACLEIKTQRGAAMPAVANMGTAETEILLPRDGAYRVISNNQQVAVTTRGKTNAIWVIQLEELPAGTLAA